MLDWFLEIDLSVFHWINVGLSNQGFDWFFPAITDLHKTTFFRAVFVPGILISMIWAKKWQGVVIFFASFITIGLSDFIGGRMKHFFERTRPFRLDLEAIQRSPAGGYSFPSNHAICMFSAAIIIAYFFPKARWPLLTMAVLVAFSRVYNGVHFPSDVIGGAIIGIACASVGILLTRAILKVKWLAPKENS